MRARANITRRAIMGEYDSASILCPMRNGEGTMSVPSIPLRRRLRFFLFDWLWID